jgi:site-specific DNA recombinase
VSNVVVIPPTKQYENDEKQILRVAAYCRVSTLEEAQASSFELQLQHYREMIEKNPEWELVKIYADEGKFGEGKTAYGLNRIKAKLKETSETIIDLAFWVMNINKRLRLLLHFFLCKLWILKKWAF